MEQVHSICIPRAEPDLLWSTDTEYKTPDQIPAKLSPWQGLCSAQTTPIGLARHRLRTNYPKRHRLTRHQGSFSFSSVDLPLRGNFFDHRIKSRSGEFQGPIRRPGDVGADVPNVGLLMALNDGCRWRLRCPSSSILHSLFAILPFAIFLDYDIPQTSGNALLQVVELPRLRHC